MARAVLYHTLHEYAEGYRDIADLTILTGTDVSNESMHAVAKGAAKGAAEGAAKGAAKGADEGAEEGAEEGADEGAGEGAARSGSSMDGESGNTSTGVVGRGEIKGEVRNEPKVHVWSPGVGVEDAVRSLLNQGKRGREGGHVGGPVFGPGRG